jgi:hypothetical protein
MRIGVCIRSSYYDGYQHTKSSVGGATNMSDDLIERAEARINVEYYNLPSKEMMAMLLMLVAVMVSPTTANPYVYGSGAYWTQNLIDTLIASLAPDDKLIEPREAEPENPICIKLEHVPSDNLVEPCYVRQSEGGEYIECHNGIFKNKNGTFVKLVKCPGTGHYIWDGQCQMIASR